MRAARNWDTSHAGMSQCPATERAETPAHKSNWDIGTLGTGGRRVTAGDTLRTLARRVERLSPSPRNPDQFHEDKSDIAYALRLMAREVRRG